MKSKNIIGGEIVPATSILFKRKKFSLDSYLKERFPGYYHSYTLSGYSSLLQILLNIRLAENDYILLPSYLCPSIILPFKKLKIKFEFYNINSNLIIDTESIENAVTPNLKALLFINYFGFPQPASVLETLKKIKQKGVLLIEDNTHSFFSGHPLIGNFVFNSFRKFLPVDGSVLLSETSISPVSSELNKKYFYHRRVAQLARSLFLKTGLNTQHFFLKHFRKAEEVIYNKNVSRFNIFDRKYIERIVLTDIVIKRIQYYNELFRDFSHLSLTGPLTNGVVPIGFPILINNRDVIREKLMGMNIFCPVHWAFPIEINKEIFNESWNLSEKILTIPISLIKENDIEYLKHCLITIIKTENDERP